MTRRSPPFLCALFVGAVFLTACAATNRAPAPPSPGAGISEAATGRIEGTITDQDGSPVGGCRVTVSHPVSGRKWKAKADMDGNFLLFGIPEGGGYHVTVSTPPIWRTTLNAIEVKAGQPTRLQVVRRLLRNHGPLGADQPVR